MTDRTRNRLVLLAIAAMALTVAVCPLLPPPTSDDAVSDAPPAQGRDGDCLGLDFQWIPCEELEQCPEDIKWAALHNIYPEFEHGINNLSASIGSVSMEDIQGQRAKVRELRQWANALEKECEKDAYLYWIRDHEKNLDEAERELKSGKRRADQEKWRAEQDREYERIDRIADRISKPPSKLGGEKETP